MAGRSLRAGHRYTISTVWHRDVGQISRALGRFVVTVAAGPPTIGLALDLLANQ